MLLKKEKKVKSKDEYLGGKMECENYIKTMIDCMPEEHYVDRTILREYEISEVSDAVFAPSFQRVEY